MALAIGLNSGSAFDGMDAVLVDIELADDGYPKRPTFIDGLSYDWPDSVAERVLRAFTGDITVFELTRLHYEAGAVYADATRALMEKNALTGADVAVIGYDGQTIYQEPPRPELVPDPPPSGALDYWQSGAYGAGLQIGEQAVVSAFCDVPTVSHFRPGDHVLGGTGAPLMQFLDFCAFRDIGPVLTLNIGGIANCHLAQADRSRMKAFDTGPGNVMIDHAMKRLYGRTFDADGAVAASGTVSQPLLDSLLSHPFFQRKAPRSAWRLDFGADYADGQIESSRHLPDEDIVATFTRFTAEAIHRSMLANVESLDGLDVLIASGGGVKNATLMRSLADLLSTEGIEIRLSDVYGIPAQFKEAIKFATLAYANLLGLASNIPAASGAKAFATLGKLTRAPRESVI